MSEQIEISGISIPKADWDATPASVQGLILVLSERLSNLEQRFALLEERLNQSSQNSSKPPSQDGLKKPEKRKSAGQGFKIEASREVEVSRGFLASERCQQVEELKPGCCSNCGELLWGEDRQPHRHQVVELPKVSPQVTEYRLHQLTCEACSHQTRAALPAEVSETGYGERLSSIVGLLSGPYRQSYRQVCQLMESLFGVSLSRGGVGRLRQELNEALEPITQEAQQYVQAQPVLHSDETSFSQGNRDGQNPTETQGWLWVLVTPWVSYFEVALSRSQATARALIGDEFEGILVSDRYGAYNWKSVHERQACWAHLKRDFTAMAQRTGVSQGIGEALLRRQRRLFRWWYHCKEGGLSPSVFVQCVERLRQGLKQELEQAARLPIDSQEKTPLAKTVRTCRQLLKGEPSLWTFVSCDAVQPTNNAAERALRPAVIWRRTSFGSQSRKGSQFVARMLTVTTSLQAQRRDLLGFFTQAFRAARYQLQRPSLIPSITTKLAPST